MDSSLDLCVLLLSWRWASHRTPTAISLLIPASGPLSESLHASNAPTPYLVINVTNHIFSLLLIH